MEWAEADEVFALLFKDDLFGDDVDDVGALADVVDGVGVDAGGAHGTTFFDWPGWCRFIVGVICCCCAEIAIDSVSGDG